MPVFHHPTLYHRLCGVCEKPYGKPLGVRGKNKCPSCIHETRKNCGRHYSNKSEDVVGFDGRKIYLRKSYKNVVTKKKLVHK